MDAFPRRPTVMTIDEESVAKFRPLTQTTVDEQAKKFLRCFITELQSRFEEVLDLAEEFKKYGPKDTPFNDLAEDKAHLFLENRGETLTVIALRQYLKVDLGTHKVSFIEYLLWKFQKTVHQLLNPPPGCRESLMRALEQAITEYQKILDEKRAREEKMAELESLANTGGVKAMKAKNELEQMKNESVLEQNKREVTTAAIKRKIEREVAKDDVFAEEQKRLEEEKKRKEEEDKRKQEESRQAFKERTKLWE